MKYSIIYPYYSRPELICTLSLNYQFYNSRAKDYEYIVVEDSKNRDDPYLHEELMKMVAGWGLKHVVDEKVSYNSAHKYNLGAEAASGDIILLSNPEVVHNGNVLGYLDGVDFTNNYVVFDCCAVNKTIANSGLISLEYIQWYEHASIRRNYHFLAAISKDNYWKCGGFNEALCDGLAYEDDFWIARVKQAGLNIINVRDPSSAHIEHPRYYGLNPEDKERLRSHNEDLWKEACRTGVY